MEWATKGIKQQTNTIQSSSEKSCSLQLFLSSLHFFSLFYSFFSSDEELEISNRLMEEVEECIDEDSEDDFEKEMLRELDESLQVKANQGIVSLHALLHVIESF